MGKTYNLKELLKPTSRYGLARVRRQNGAMNNSLALVLAPLVHLGLALACQAQTALPHEVRAVLQTAQVPETSFSALVLPAGGGMPRLAHLEAQPRSPASTMKLVTTLVALEELGPNFRWNTQLWMTSAQSSGTPRGGVLRGTLYLQGGGDPNLTWDSLRGMLRSLRAQGVRHIRGDLVLDRTYFKPARPDLGAPQFDETPAAYYNVIPDALLLNSNMLTLALDSDAQGSSVRVTPDLKGLRVVTEHTLNDTDCKQWDDDTLTVKLEPQSGGKMLLRLGGPYPKNCKSSVGLNVVDRNVYIEQFVRSFWSELGGTWQGKLQDGSTPAEAKLLVARPSDTLGNIVKLINKPSDNAMTRALFMTLGETRKTTPRLEKSSDNAVVVVNEWFDRKGIARSGLVLDNGSGLSRSERISAIEMAGLLQVGLQSNWYPEFAASMPIAGLDGTMRRRFKDSPLVGKIRVKTGTLRDTAAVAGYVRDMQGKDWVVVAFINDDNSKHGRPALDALIEWVARGDLVGK
ncbi:MAG: D-alanyl-D-alanine carboxypeptidase/D-alanyl-D-alanine-endopeptidase [Burkholderiales bacterium PBB4]|nr:MAG: D-alanyl-D-alanine carboxypeptidase/D-alanyl-D-alanine-endopeptidase [Burkholderiales bacterium PBB4]